MQAHCSFWNNFLSVLELIWWSAIITSRWCNTLEINSLLRPFHTLSKSDSPCGCSLGLALVSGGDSGLERCSHSASAYFYPSWDRTYFIISIVIQMALMLLKVEYFKFLLRNECTLGIQFKRNKQCHWNFLPYSLCCFCKVCLHFTSLAHCLLSCYFYKLYLSWFWSRSDLYENVARH